MVLQIGIEGLFGQIVGSLAVESVRGWLNPLRATCNCQCPKVEFPPQGSHTADSCSCVCPAVELGPLVEVLNSFGSYTSVILIAAFLGVFALGLAVGCACTLLTCLCTRDCHPWFATRSSPDIERRRVPKKQPLTNLKALVEAAGSSNGE